MTGLGEALARAQIRADLRENREERERLHAELDASRARSGQLVTAARRHGLTVADIEDATGYSREKVYELLRGRVASSKRGRPKTTTEGRPE